VLKVNPTRGKTKSEPRSTRFHSVSTGNSRSTESAFLNVPYDEQYEPLFLALIAGLCRFGLTPRATIEIPGSQRRLNRIIEVIGKCSYSFHDLSRVTLDHRPPRTPRFNMPFELGLAVAMAANGRSVHRWFVLESHPHRLNKSLSDLDGTDLYIHDNKPEGMLRALMNALVQFRDPPALTELRSILRKLRTAALKMKEDLGDAPLFEAHAFKELVFVANDIISRRSPPRPIR
jgi:hypothetical protein